MTLDEWLDVHVFVVCVRPHQGQRLAQARGVRLRGGAVAEVQQGGDPHELSEFSADPLVDEAVEVVAMRTHGRFSWVAG
jgi:hypothetical protein